LCQKALSGGHLMAFKRSTLPRRFKKSSRDDSQHPKIQPFGDATSAEPATGQDLQVPPGNQRASQTSNPRMSRSNPPLTF
jgi:hypothetical protein